MVYNRKDFFFKQAKKENYAARSIFKLQEIDNRLKIIKSGYKVLDMGAAPGSWAQYTSEKIGPQGRILGIDIEPIQITLYNAVFLQADLRSAHLADIMKEHGFEPTFDVVLSDMAPNTTGIRITDQARSMELCELALATAEKFLRHRGSFVAKLFHSEDFEVFRDMLRERFGRVEIIRPKSVRKESKEIFFVALLFKGGKAETTPGSPK
jgi:23S rRNA (uridine2552-2'-O)-methyltransferase